MNLRPFLHLFWMIDKSKHFRVCVLFYIIKYFIWNISIICFREETNLFKIISLLLLWCSDAGKLSPWICPVKNSLNYYFIFGWWEHSSSFLKRNNFGFLSIFHGGCLEPMYTKSWMALLIGSSFSGCSVKEIQFKVWNEADQGLPGATLYFTMPVKKEE